MISTSRLRNAPDSRLRQLLLLELVMKKFLIFLKWAAIIFVVMSVIFLFIVLASQFIHGQWETDQPEQVTKGLKLW